MSDEQKQHELRQLKAAFREIEAEERDAAKPSILAPPSLGYPEQGLISRNTPEDPTQEERIQALLIKRAKPVKEYVIDHNAGRTKQTDLVDEEVSPFLLKRHMVRDQEVAQARQRRLDALKARLEAEKKKEQK